MDKLKDLTKDIDIYISQHAIYINKLEKAINGKIDFSPVDCHSCAFGKAFDSIRECIEGLPEDLKKLLREIDSLHCEFHELSQNIVNDKNNIKRINEIEDVSTKLFQKLLKLKNKIKNTDTKRAELKK